MVPQLDAESLLSGIEFPNRFVAAFTLSILGDCLDRVITMTPIANAHNVYESWLAQLRLFVPPFDHLLRLVLQTNQAETPLTPEETQLLSVLPRTFHSDGYDDLLRVLDTILRIYPEYASKHSADIVKIMSGPRFSKRSILAKKLTLSILNSVPFLRFNSSTFISNTFFSYIY